MTQELRRRCDDNDDDDDDNHAICDDEDDDATTTMIHDTISCIVGWCPSALLPSHLTRPRSSLMLFFIMVLNFVDC